MDEEAAKANPLFGGRVAHGYLVLAFTSGLFVDPAPGPVLTNYGRAFADEIYCAPESWARAAYPRLIHYRKFGFGTHFAAWEQPATFVEEMRASFRTLRVDADLSRTPHGPNR